MTFPFPWAGGYSRAKATYVNKTPVNGSNLTSYTFSSITVDKPGLYAFVVNSQATSTGGTSKLSTLSVGGVGATIIANTNPGTYSCVSAIAYIRLTGTSTGSIIASFSAQMGMCVIGIYRITGNKSDIPVDAKFSGTYSAASLNLTLNVPRGCAAVFGAESYNGGSAVTVAWAGATQDAYGQYSTQSVGSFASIPLNNSVLAAKSVTATATVSGKMSLSGASWR